MSFSETGGELVPARGGSHAFAGGSSPCWFGERPLFLAACPPLALQLAPTKNPFVLGISTDSANIRCSCVKRVGCAKCSGMIEKLDSDHLRASRSSGPVCRGEGQSSRSSWVDDVE
ncbi:uncharacterized protein DS421_16g533140 [Arachis hypogaea]|nr:uncharacterized protein DS421_16g533140 [Arachis hypogaea]